MVDRQPNRVLQRFIALKKAFGTNFVNSIKMNQMKRLLLLFLPFLSLAQTTYTEMDIRAASGNQYETLLVGVPAIDTDSFIQNYTYMSTRWEARRLDDFGKCDKCYHYIVENHPVGDQSHRYIEVKILYKDLGPDIYDKISTKVVLTGDYDLLVQFFTQFWSRTVNLDDIKPGEVATTRFLSDVAAFSFNSEGKPQIVVESAADRG